MLARLTIYATDRPARQVILSDAEQYLIGRDKSCSLHIADDTLSRRHAKLVFRDGRWCLSDLASKNGTLIGGQPANHHPLTDHAWFEMGNVLASFDHVSRAALSAEHARNEDRWQSSIHVSRALTPELEPGELLRRVLDSVIDLSGCERGFVMLRQHSGDLVPDVSEPATAGRFLGSQSVIAKVLAERRPVTCSDIVGDASLSDRPSIAAGDILALACLPMMIGDQTIGVVYVDSRKPGKSFTELDIEMMQAMADHAALVIGVARLRDNIADLSGMLPAELHRDQRSPSPLVQKLNELLPRLDDDRSPGIAVVGADS